MAGGGVEGWRGLGRQQLPHAPVERQGAGAALVDAAELIANAAPNAAGVVGAGSDDTGTCRHSATSCLA